MSSADANLRANVGGRVDVGGDAAPTSANVGGNVGRPLITVPAGVQPPQVVTYPAPFPPLIPVSGSFDLVCGQTVGIPSGLSIGVLQLLSAGKIELLITGNEGVLTRTGTADVAARFPTLPFDSASGQFHWESSGGLIVFEIPVQLVGTFFLAPTTGNGGTVHVCCDCGLGAYWAFDKGVSGSGTVADPFLLPDDVSGCNLQYSYAPLTWSSPLNFGYFELVYVGEGGVLAVNESSVIVYAPPGSAPFVSTQYTTQFVGDGTFGFEFQGLAGVSCVISTSNTLNAAVYWDTDGSFADATFQFFEDGDGNLINVTGYTWTNQNGGLACIDWNGDNNPVTITVTATVPAPPAFTTPACLGAGFIDQGFSFQFPPGDEPSTNVVSESTPLLGFDPTKSNGITMYGWFKLTGTPASIPAILRWSDNQGQSLVLVYTIPSGVVGV